MVKTWTVAPSLVVPKTVVCTVPARALPAARTTSAHAIPSRILPPIILVLFPCGFWALIYSIRRARKKKIPPRRRRGFRGVSIDGHGAEYRKAADCGHGRGRLGQDHHRQRPGREAGCALRGGRFPAS